MLELSGKQVDGEGVLKVLKGNRGLSIFNTQSMTNSNHNIDEKIFFASKLLSHEQAKQMRDYLIEQYPLEVGNESTS